MADIKEVEANVASDEEVTDVPIFQKNGDPYLAPDGTPSTIGVVGSESKQYRQAQDRLTRRMLKSGRAKLEPDDLRKSRIDQAVAAVVRWHGWEKDGKEFHCTIENVRTLLAIGHILEQVEAGVTSHADFFAKRSSN